MSWNIFWLKLIMINTIVKSTQNCIVISLVQTASTQFNLICNSYWLSVYDHIVSIHLVILSFKMLIKLIIILFMFNFLLQKGKYLIFVQFIKKSNLFSSFPPHWHHLRSIDLIMGDSWYCQMFCMLLFYEVLHWPQLLQFSRHMQPALFHKCNCKCSWMSSWLHVIFGKWSKW